MIRVENKVLNKVFSDDSISHHLKKQLVEEFKKMENHVASLEQQLKVKEGKINSLSQTIATLKTANKINDHLIYEDQIERLSFIEDTEVEKKNNLPSLKAKRGNSFPPFWKDFKFLMIEDNRADIILLKSIFKLWELNLATVSTIQEAKEKMQEQQYDCILSDVVLPDGDGLGHILELRLDEKAINQNTAVIIITAKANKGGARAAQLANVQCYFNKPFSLKQLKKGLEQILEPKKCVDKISTKVVLDSKDSWTWLDILNHNLNGRYHLMEEFMAIFLKQAKNITKLLANPSTKENLDQIQYDIFKFQSTVNTIGLKDSYDLISQIGREVMIEFNHENLDRLIAPCICQLEKDIAKVELQIN